jgi:gamma-glutamyl hydrolase
VLFCLLLVAVVIGAQGFSSQKDAPIIGIVVEPPLSTGECTTYFKSLNERGELKAISSNRFSNNTSGCVWSIYVTWLHSAGIRVVPIPWKIDTPAEKSNMDWLLARVNGILFTGGVLDADVPILNHYFETVKYVYAYTQHRNKVENDPFAMWGTCQGFQLISAAAAGSLAVIEDGFVGMDPSMLPMQLTPDAANSRMFGTAPNSNDDEFKCSADVVTYVSKFPTTLNYHHEGVPPTAAAQYPSLGAELRTLGISADTTGRQFVAAVEGVNTSIFAVQFHPERVTSDFSNSAITHDHRSMAVSQYLALFLRDRLAANSHSFDTPEQGNSMTIENYPASNQGWGNMIYYIN